MALRIDKVMLKVDGSAEAKITAFKVSIHISHSVKES